MDCEDSVLDDERLDELLKLLDDELTLDELDEDELLSELLVETLELLDNEDSVLDDELELPELSDDNELELLSLLLDSVELDDSLLRLESLLLERLDDELSVEIEERLDSLEVELD